MGRKDFVWDKNEFSKHFRTVQNSEEFVATFAKLKTNAQAGSLESSTDSSIDTSSTSASTSSTGRTLSPRQSVPTKRKASASDKQSSTSSSSSKKAVDVPLLYKSKETRNPSQEEDEDDEMAQIKAQVEKSYIGTFLIHVENLQLGKQVRDVDQKFVEKLKANMNEYPNHCYQPLAVTIETLPDQAKFREADVNGYKYSLLGGQHNFLAAKQISEEKPDLSLFSSRLCAVYDKSLSNNAALWLSNQHNKVGEYRHTMVLREEVALCREIFQRGEENWKKSCSVILGKDARKPEMKTVLALSSMVDGPYNELRNVFLAHEQSLIKGLKVRTTTKKLPELKSYSLGKILPLPDADKIKMLKGLADGQFSLTEFAAECAVLSKLHTLQIDFIDMTGCAKWEEALRSYPAFTSREALLPYCGLTRASKDEFRRFCRRAKESVNVPNSQTECLHGVGESRGYIVEGKVFNDVMPEQFKDFDGFDLTILDLRKTWTEEQLRHFCVELTSMNLTAGMPRFSLVLLVEIDRQADAQRVLNSVGQFSNTVNCFYNVENIKKGATEMVADCVFGMVVGVSARNTRATIEWEAGNSTNLISCKMGQLMTDENGMCLDPDERPASLYKIVIEALTEKHGWVLDAGSKTGTGLITSLAKERNATLLIEGNEALPFIRKNVLKLKTSQRNYGADSNSEDDASVEEMEEDEEDEDVEEDDVERDEVEEDDEEWDKVEEDHMEERDEEESDVEEGVEEGDVEEGDVEEGDVEEGNVEEGEEKVKQVDEDRAGPSRVGPSRGPLDRWVKKT